MTTLADLTPLRPIMPDGYGVPESTQGTLPWSYVEEQFTQARNYWVVSVRPDGRPHAMPVWGVWLDGLIYFEGSSETRRSRNLIANPHAIVHLESGNEVVIVEGIARMHLPKPPLELAEKLVQVYSTKYAWAGYVPTINSWDGGGLYDVTPETVFAWTNFPQDVTKWQLK